MSDRIKVVKVAGGMRVVREGAAGAGVAQAEAERANQFKQSAAGFAAMALAIFGSTQAMQDALATASNQNSLAQMFAAQAASVAQQDLSGVTAAALHRSPNPIIALLLYDTSKDSDGGAWVAKVDVSYLYETLSGTYLGAFASEAAARAVTGATTGDYFQLTTDGKFYRLSAGAGTAETFRGNKARFPRVAGVVVEQTRLVIYDLLEPGRPMWMVFSANWFGPTGSTANMLIALAANPLSGVAALNGMLAVAANNNTNMPLVLINFAKDGATGKDTTTSYTYRGSIAQRNAGMSNFATAGGGIAGGLGNAVAMTAMPDAPVDPVTGLQLPTIAVATSAGVSVIKHDGSVVSSASAGAFQSVSINPNSLHCSQSTNANFNYAVQPTKLSASFALTTVSAGTAQMAFNIPTGALMPNRRTAAKRSAAGIELALLNESIPAASLSATIAPASNTGWMVGDVRRCMFSDTVTGAAQGAVASDDFSGGVAAWTAYLAAVVTDAGAKMRVAIGVGGQSSRAARGFATLPGARYVATADVVGVNANGGSTQFANVFASNNVDATAAFASSTSVSAPTAGLVVEFTATQATTYIGLGAGGNGTAGSYIEWDNFVLTQVVADRSYKGKSAAIVGTLTKTAVASAAQLVFWSGFSAANYAQEAYSSDLDFGTGGFALPAWVSIPAVLPAANFPDVSAELLANGTFDTDTVWVKGTGWSIAGGVGTHDTGAAGSAISQGASVGGKFYRIGYAVSGWTQGNHSGYAGGVVGAANNGNGAFSQIVKASNTSGLGIQSGGNGGYNIDNVSAKEVGPAWIVDRSAAAGPYWRLGVNPDGALVGEIYDGATTRTVTSPTSYAGAGSILAELSLATSGSLTLRVNGEQVAQATGAPLATLSNAAAVLTLGNRRALDAPFPGSVALVRPTATIPSDDASRFIYQQERAMFRDGAQVTLPDAGALVDLDYDPTEDKWKPVSAANESTFVGLVRTASAPASSGSISKVAHKGGMKLIARTTTNPGVDVTVPPQNLKSELLRRAEELGRLQMPLPPMDWTGAFTATTINNSAVLTISGLVIPAGATIVGVRVSGTNIPPGATIVYWNGGTNVHLSAPCTGTLAGVTVSMQDVILPPGHSPHFVGTAGSGVREGTTWTRGFDGFRERVMYGSVPGNQWLQVETRRIGT